MQSQGVVERFLNIKIQDKNQTVQSLRPPTELPKRNDFSCDFKLLETESSFTLFFYLPLGQTVIHEFFPPPPTQNPLFSLRLFEESKIESRLTISKIRSGFTRDFCVRYITTTHRHNVGVFTQTKIRLRKTVRGSYGFYFRRRRIFSVRPFDRQIYSTPGVTLR